MGIKCDSFGTKEISHSKSTERNLISNYKNIVLVDSLGLFSPTGLASSFFVVPYMILTQSRLTVK